MATKSRIFKGRWRRGNSLSAGGQGDVYRVEDLRNEHKGPLLLKQLRHPEELRPRFEREVRAMASLRHPSIPRILDFQLDGERPFFITDNLGETLQDIVKQQRLTASEIIRLFIQLSEALCLVHQKGIIHRDIKPQNIVVTTDLSRACFIDFGIATFLREATNTVAGPERGRGTWAYAPPELGPGATEEPSFRSDVYSLAKTLFWALFGVVVERERIAERLQELPEGACHFRLRNLFMKSIRESSDTRIHAHEFRDCLEEYCRGNTLIETEKKQGRVVVEDTIGMVTPFIFSGKLAKTAGSPGANGVTRLLGRGFQASETVKLGEFWLPLKSTSSNPFSFRVELRKNAENQPSDDVVESWEIEGNSGHGVVVRLLSQDSLSILLKDEVYWLIFEILHHQVGDNLVDRQCEWYNATWINQKKVWMIDGARDDNGNISWSMFNDGWNRGPALRILGYVV